MFPWLWAPLPPTVPELKAAEFAVLVVEGPPELVEVVPIVWVCAEPEPV